MNSGRRVQIEDGLYQVWDTEYPLNGDDPSAKHDPGHRLSGTFKNIEEAVSYMNQRQSYRPQLTKLVTYQVKVIDISEVLDDRTQ